MISILLSLFLIGDTLKINLQEAKQIAIEKNLTYGMEVMDNRYNRLGLYESIASFILDPEVGVTYSDATYEQWSHTSTKGYNFNLLLQQPVFDISEIASIIQNKSSLNVSEASLEEARNALYYQVEADYLTVLKAEKMLEMRKKALERAEENKRLISKKLEIGQASRLDSLNAEVYLNRSRLNLSSAKKEHQIARRVFLNLLGIGHQCEILLAPVEIKKDIYLPDIDTLIAISLMKRPRIRSAYENLKNAKVAHWGSILSFLPSLSFKWFWNYNSENFPERFSTIREGTTKTSGWYASANLNLFSYPFEVSKTKTVVDKASLNLLNERLVVVKEVKEAWLECINIYENLNLARSLFETAKESSKLAELQYNMGLISTLELLQVENELLNAEITYLFALYDCTLAKAMLNYVSGNEL